MAIPVYLWLKYDDGTDIKGSVDILQREGSIEVLELMHAVEVPVDSQTGKLIAKRIHCSYAFEKEVDASSPYLYKAVSSGQTLKNAEFKFYCIDYGGQEKEYFRVTLENVKVISVEPFMHDIKNELFERHTHHEYVELSYEKIIWHYLGGNIVHSDTWNERA
ncbi:Hcp family type VI secretion system effector [Rahnella aceris]|jgi:type VI secretion system secreted protein Hcp|uniref:Hcp family type VI secretion system effector n=1 Tax=Rahnella TaxID=34037 RepID=UPI000DC1FDCD|nr:MULTISPECIES: type VI secretion system tube protein TssD [Rahnella]MQB53677.1 type VI secretion system tube protein Hcp [Rahnella sp. RcJ3]UNK54093.1 type VI secretion system tube protein Hcp [Rahnella aceris]